MNELRLKKRAVYTKKAVCLPRAGVYMARGQGTTASISPGLVLKEVPRLLVRSIS